MARRLGTIVVAAAVLGGLAARPTGWSLAGPTSAAGLTIGRGSAGGSLATAAVIGGSALTVASDGGDLYFGAGAAVYRYHPSAGGLDLTTRQPLAGLVQGVSMRDGLAYIALGAAGVEIRDARQGASSDAWPLVGRMTFAQAGAFASKVVFAGQRAYVILGLPGVRIVDITNPGQPRDLGGFGQFVTDVAATDAAAAVVSRRLQLYDVADPAAARDILELAKTADAVAVVGQSLFAAVSTDPASGPREFSLRAWDLTNPRRPAAQDSAPLAGQARQVALAGNRLLVPAGDRLHVFNADAAHLRQLDALPLTENAQEVAQAGADYGIAAGDSGPRLFSASSGAAGLRLTEGIIRPETMHFDEASGRLFVEDADERILVFNDARFNDAGLDQAVPIIPAYVMAQPVQTGVIGTRDGLLYVGTPARELLVYDLRDPRDLGERLKSPSGRLKFAESPSRLAVGEGYVFVATDPYLRVIDVHDPAHPRKVYELTPSGGITDLALGEGYLYVTGPMTGLHDPQPSFKVIDVRNPVRPREVASLPAIGNGGGIATDKAYVYIEDLQAIDACVATKPLETARFDTDGRTQDVALQGRALLTAKRFAQGGGLVRLYDRADPARPVEAASLPLLDAVDDLVFLAANRNPAPTFLAASRDMGLVVGHVQGLAGPAPTPTPAASPSPAPTIPLPPGFDARAYLPLTWRVLTGPCGR